MAALGSLVAGVAHEVRNPLFGISSTLDAFEARVGRTSDYQRYVSTLRGEVDRLGMLMTDLLEYARPTALEISPVALPEVVTQAMRICEPLARRHGVVIENAVPAQLPLVPLDRRRMAQVVHNVIDNAIRHSSPGDRVRVEATLLEDGRSLRLAVRDCGRGFEGRDLPKLFEPFFTKRKGGTGLGLSIVQRIVEQHGGQVQATNHPGGGAEVAVTLRLAHEREAEPAAS
jgi:signal transduction histidine kinase